MISPEELARLGGVLHFTILVASAFVPKVLNWKAELRLLNPFLRRLFWVYGVFIVLTIVGFGTISLVCAEEIASGSQLARGFAAFVAVFWTARLGVQFFVFDARPFLTNWFFKAGYHGLAVLFAVLVALYGWIFFRA